MDACTEKYLNTARTGIGTLDGIGPKRAEAFSRLGIETLYDLSRHFPRAYQNRGNIRLLCDAEEGESCSFLLTVGTQPRSATLKKRITVTKFSAFDESGTVNITYFNARFIEKSFSVGMSYRFWGKVKKVGKRYEMISPAFEPCLPGKVLPDFIPVYPCSEGLTQKLISDSVSASLDSFFRSDVPEIIPPSLSRELGLLTPLEALHYIHKPQCFGDIEKARRYFAAEQSYLFALALSFSKQKRAGGRAPRLEKVKMDRFLSALPFSMTGAQKRSVDEIYQDMIGSSAPMTRLLTGDVGSGKTAVAAAAIFLSAANGYQSALMAPTEILAIQHYNYFQELFKSFGYRTELLIGAMGAAKKKEIQKALANGEIDIIIGTHALLSSGVEFKSLALVITDEQHRFGVAQRARLGEKNRAGQDPHVLVMSATPIPRTLALILYGDLSLSMLDELPPGRERVETYLVDESYRERINAFIEKQVKDGGQVYIVCPAIEEKQEELSGDLLSFDGNGESVFSLDAPKLKAASEHCERLKRTFPEMNVALMHGRMKGKEKEEIMSSFEQGETQILVSTTVIEVGINVPNASLMIIEDADRFGLSQLHQLRGRVGRGKRKSYCVLISSAKGEKAKERLDVMKRTSDGFKIAERDLEMRGPGDYFPSSQGEARQHGSFGTLISPDMPLLKKAMLAAEEVLRDDPCLEHEENSLAKALIERDFEVGKRAMQ